MPALNHQEDPSLTAETATKDYLQWLDDDAFAERNEPQEDSPVKSPLDDNLSFESDWLRQH
jgi:hypothetical protein